MSGILIRKAVGMMSERPGEFFKRVIPAILIPLIGMVAILLAFSFNLKSAALEKFLSGAESPYAVLAAYDQWYGYGSVLSGSSFDRKEVADRNHFGYCFFFDWRAGESDYGGG